MNSGCAGSITFAKGDIAGATFEFVIIGGGTEVFGIDTIPGITDTFDAKKQ